MKDKGSSSCGKEQLRLVVDFRNLNAKIHLNEYPLSLTRTVIDRLPKTEIFTKFDVRAGFNNIRIRPGDEEKTAFKQFFGLFQYNVIPFGLTTAESYFQHLINMVLNHYLDIYFFAYLDDIIVFSENAEEHEKHVRLILEALVAHSFRLKPS